MVVGVALSGLVAFAPSLIETDEVDTCLLALARNFLRGDATHIDGHVRTRPSNWTWKHLKLAEWSTERIPPPNVPRDEQVLPLLVSDSDIELPFVCEQV